VKTKINPGRPGKKRPYKTRLTGDVGYSQTVASQSPESKETGGDFHSSRGESGPKLLTTAWVEVIEKTRKKINKDKRNFSVTEGQEIYSQEIPLPPYAQPMVKGDKKAPTECRESWSKTILKKVAQEAISERAPTSRPRLRQETEKCRVQKGIAMTNEETRSESAKTRAYLKRTIKGVALLRARRNRGGTNFL